eukprot:UN27160
MLTLSKLTFFVSFVCLFFLFFFVNDFGGLIFKCLYALSRIDIELLFGSAISICCFSGKRLSCIVSFSFCTNLFSETLYLLSKCRG